MTHVALTREGAVYKIYIDGELQHAAVDEDPHLPNAQDGRLLEEQDISLREHSTMCGFMIAPSRPMKLRLACRTRHGLCSGDSVFGR